MTCCYGEPEVSFIVQVSALQSAEEEKSVTAILLLLNIVMPEWVMFVNSGSCDPMCRISDAVLRSQFTEISKLLMDKLACYERSSSTALLKSVSGSHDQWITWSTCNIGGQWFIGVTVSTRWSSVEWSVNSSFPSPHHQLRYTPQTKGNVWCNITSLFVYMH